MRLLALLAVLAALPAFAEDKVEVKPGVKKGLKFTRSVEIKGEGHSSAELGDTGNEIRMKAAVSIVQKSAEEITDSKSGVPSALRRRYVRRDSSLNFGWFGGIGVQGGLTGKELTYADGKWSGGTEDELKEEPVVDRLTEAIASGKVVTVGNTWEADKTRIKAWIEYCFPVLEVDEAEMECKLAEFKEKDGQKCARIEIAMKAKGKLKIKDNPRAVSLSLKGDVYFGTEVGMALVTKAEGKLKSAKKDDEEDETDPSGFSNIKLEVPVELEQTVKVGEADFSAKVEEPPKPPRPDWFPPPIR